MVSSLATKVHKTLHHIETDETMVRHFLIRFPHPALNEFTSCLSSRTIRRALPENKSSSWDDETGAASKGMRPLTKWCSTFVLRGRRGMARQLGECRASLSIEYLLNSCLIDTLPKRRRLDGFPLLRLSLMR